MSATCCSATCACSQSASRSRRRRARSRPMAAPPRPLELTARQAELLALANSMGEISLSLRSIADIAGSGGPEFGEDLKASKDGRAVRVLRYGVGSRAYSVN